MAVTHSRTFLSHHLYRHSPLNSLKKLQLLLTPVWTGRKPQKLTSSRLIF
ncbi:hypothetical protein Pint_07253 [Pistacia integerrima]|uniref:Uncharacterized protein n=1 Tax=Pistacia integerrima TaxID=434235 RepID=A0ACC0Y057_9ROSI|nr:hypothetical protein Pint_07253 [Pistacia integerrima]